METLNADVLKQILALSDDRELIYFLNSNDKYFNERVVSVLNDNSFWLEKLESELGFYIQDEVSKNWKKYYLNYRKVLEEQQKDLKFFNDNIDLEPEDSDSFKDKLFLAALLKVRDIKLIRILSNRFQSYEDDNDFMQRYLEDFYLAKLIVQTGSVKILEYLIKIEYLNLIGDEYLVFVTAVIDNFNEDIAEYLIANYVNADDEIVTNMISLCSLDLLRKISTDKKFDFVFQTHNYPYFVGASLENFTFFIEFLTNKDVDFDMKTLLEEIVQKNAFDKLVYLLDGKEGLFSRYGRDLLKRALKPEGFKCFSYLLSNMERSDKMNHLLYIAIENRYLPFVKLLLEKVDNVKINKVMKFAFKSKSSLIVKLLLNEFEVDNSIIVKYVVHTNEETLRLLLDDDRFGFKKIAKNISYNNNLSKEFYSYLLSHPKLTKIIYDTIFKSVRNFSTTNAVESLLASPFFSKTKLTGLGNSFIQDGAREDFLIMFLPYILSYYSLRSALTNNFIKLARLIAKDIPSISTDYFNDIKELTFAYGYQDIIDVLKDKIVK